MQQSGEQRRRVGRPAGLYGNPAVRQALRAAREHQCQAQEVRPVGRPQQPQQRADEEPASDQVAVVLSDHLTDLQEMVLRHALDQSKHWSTPNANNPADKILFQGKRHVVSARVHSDDFTSRDLRFTASALCEATGGLWCNFLSKIEQTLDAGNFEGLMFSIRRRYDETPLQLRIADSLQDSGTDTGSQTQCQSTTLSLLLTRESSPSLASTSSSKRTAKVMQSELFITALIKDKRSGGACKFQGNCLVFCSACKIQRLL